MFIRVGKVTNVFADEGKAKVYFEDLKSASAKLPVMTFNNEFAMPKVNDMVVTLHMEHVGQGFILGTYWSSENRPPQSTAYQKKYDDNSYLKIDGTTVKIHANEIEIENAGGSVSVSDIQELITKVATLESKVSALESAL